MTFLHSGGNPQINLSAEEMLAISQEISRNFTSCFTSPALALVEKIRLSPMELLDIGEEIGRDFAPKPSCHSPELMLLPVDPGHLYVYWNLGEHSKPDNDQLVLRIYSESDEESEAAETASWFDVAIDSPATHQQVSLPDPVEETAFSAAIGHCGADHSFIELAHSNIIHAHRVRTAWHQGYENSTACQRTNASGLGISK
jgi:hypothetical protein